MRIAWPILYPPSSILYLLIGMVVCLAASGCSSGLIKAKGKVVRDGQPVQVGKRERLDVTFFPYTEGKAPEHMYGASVNDADGIFEVRGRKGKGIPPGKYRVTVRILNNTSDKDRLKNAFGMPNSPIIRDVTSAKEEILIDIGKPAP